MNNLFTNFIFLSFSSPKRFCLDITNGFCFVTGIVVEFKLRSIQDVSALKFCTWLAYVC